MNEFSASWTVIAGLIAMGIVLAVLLVLVFSSKPKD
jgi:hypothetical protein